IIFFKHKTAYEIETRLEFRRVLFRSAETGPDSQFTARDLNDLGQALIEAGELTESAEHLRRAISLYESELPEHGYSVQPRMHLARALTAQAMQEHPFTPALLEEAREVL